MSDIERAFTYLHDNISSWCASLTEIGEKATVMQNEIAKMPPSGSPKLRKKTGSVESIRDLDAIMDQPNPSAAAQSSPMANRKRKTPSLMSGHFSGPSKLRSRRMIIIYYDGQIQKSFETLVRSIGTGRNMLRKGKMAAKMQTLSDLAGSDPSEDDDDEDPIASKIAYRRRAALPSMRTRAMMRGTGAAADNFTPTELFETTDKALELAQGLCEKAAHQSLRDGDCRKELEGMRKHFEAVLETATQQVARYQARKETETVTEELKVDTPPSTKIEPKPVAPTIHHIPSVPISTKAAIDIEVDDDEDDETDFVVPPIRFTSRR